MAKHFFVSAAFGLSVAIVGSSVQAEVIPPAPATDPAPIAAPAAPAPAVETPVVTGPAAAAPDVTATAGVACFAQPAKLSDATTATFSANPAALLADFPDGGLGLSSRVRALTGSSMQSLSGVMSLVASATPKQVNAIGTGLGRAARACSTLNPDYAGEIQRQVAESNNEALIAAFAGATDDVQTAALGDAAAAAGGGASDIGGGAGGVGGAGGAGGSAGATGTTQQGITTASTAFNGASGGSRYFSANTTTTTSGSPD